MKKIFFYTSFTLGVLCLNCSSKSSPDACLMSEDFIKRDLTYPEESELPFLDCHATDNGNGNFTVLRKITAKNAFGVKSNYIYKLELHFNGGIEVDKNNWELVSILSEKAQ